MVGDSMPELRREAEALGADAVALAGPYSLASRQRAGAFGLSAGMANGSSFGMGSGAASGPGQSRKEVDRRETAFAHFESHVLGVLSAVTHQARRDGRTVGTGQASLGVCMQSGRIAKIDQGGRVLFEYPLAASVEPCLWTQRSIDGMRCVR